MIKRTTDVNVVLIPTYLRQFSAQPFIWDWRWCSNRYPFFSAYL